MNPLPRTETRLVIALLLLTALRVAAGARTPLTADEAYFWQWSRHLAWCYHDQPPLIAWVTALLTRLAGTSAATVRLSGPLFNAAAAWLVFRLGRRLTGSDRTATTAALLVLLVPVFAVTAMMATVETPLLFSWCLALFFCHRALCEDNPRGWYGAGLALGLGLLSKYQALLLLPSLGLFFFLVPAKRRLLRTVHPWLGLGLALAIFSPVLAWNARHEWVNFSLNFIGRRDLVPDGASAARALAHLPVFLAGQAAAVSPLLLPLLAAALWRLRGRRQPAESFLFAFSAPTLFFFALAATMDSVPPHWPALAWPTAFIGLAAGAPRAGRRRFYNAALGLALGSGLLLTLLPLRAELLIGREPARPGRAGTLETFYSGWPAALGARAVALRNEMTAAENKETFLLCRGFSLGTYLAFYAPGRPETLAVFQQSPQGQAHLFWQQAARRRGDNAIFIGEAHENPRFLEEIRRAFARVEAAPGFRLETDDGRLVKDFHLWRCYDFQGLPAAEPAWALERARRR